MSKEENIRPNFEKINYNLRPAKNVERKMLCEAFSRLSLLESIRRYRYIGFGSAYFSDFSLFHKTLGITKLLSIEKEKEYASRIEFNKPLSCVDVEYGESSEVLVTLPWKRWKEKSIIWLDYTGKLTESILGDIRTVVSELKPGSVFFLSVNVDQDKKPESYKLTTKEFRIKKLKSRFAEQDIPKVAYDLNLNTDENSSLMWEIIDNTIRNTVLVRNGGLDAQDKLSYKQIFNFYYDDSVSMLTVGGIIYDNSQAKRVREMSFENLEFVRTGRESFNISVPNLTFREIHALDKLLPNKEAIVSGTIKKVGKKLPLEAEDIKNYANIYRYFPAFTEANL